MWLPNLWRLVQRRVDRLSARGDEKLALKAAKAYVQRRPKDPEAWNLLAQTLLRFDRLEDAKSVLREGLARNPDSLTIADLLISVLLYPAHPGEIVSRQDFQEGWRLIEALLESHPDSPLPYADAARFFQNVEEWEDARRFAAESEKRLAVTADPHIARALGATLLGIPGERQKALELIQRAADAGERSAPLILAVLIEGKQPDKANRYLLMARNQWGGSPEEWEEEVKEQRAWARTVPE